ncbi:SAF domain-containing protein [Ornithinimicrobium sp. Y1847]|uniref:SAF domain-containing protein n=2 Tax=Ornithinimicrobium sp. Y1847 TaxID=3405419 RepID=UPI003B67187B
MLFSRRSRARPRSPSARGRGGLSRRRRWMAALMAALVVGGLAHLFLNRPSPDAVPVVVATTTVGVGTPLSSSQVTVREIPGDAIPEGALSDLDSVVGRPTAAVLSPGEVLTRYDVHQAAQLAHLPEGGRAFFLPVPEPAVARALQAGDRVDVHSPLDGSVTVADVVVLAVVAGEGGGGTLLSAGGGGSPAQPGAWLSLTPVQAEAVAAARGADPSGAALLVALRAG